MNGDGPRVVTDRDEAAELLALIDRFEGLLERSDLAELEVQAGDTMLRLAKPAAPVAAVVGAGAPAGITDAPRTGPAGEDEEIDAGLHAVVAPLTGVFYGSPTPEAAPYVREGGAVSAGQVIGLIEAMKLFNEIKSDITGTVQRIAVESGALVKQKQVLIEVIPS